MYSRTASGWNHTSPAEKAMNPILAFPWGDAGPRDRFRAEQPGSNFQTFQAVELAFSEGNARS